MSRSSEAWNEENGETEEEEEEEEEGGERGSRLEQMHFSTVEILSSWLHNGYYRSPIIVNPNSTGHRKVM